MDGRVALISIHPRYADKIISGEKKLEFRRSWAVQPVDVLVIYATYPVQRIVALAGVEKVILGSPNKLWSLSKDLGGGISRRDFFAYLDGKTTAVAIELGAVRPVVDGLDPTRLFGQDFRAPQSFRYLKQAEHKKLCKLVGGCLWA